VNVLIVDDEPASLLVNAARVRRLGHTVATAGDGEAAWGILGRDYWPVVISDVHMPFLDGTGLCRRIRDSERREYTYVIMLTADDREGAYAAGMDAGADDFLTKPCDHEQLAARLRVAERILGLRDRVKQLEGFLSICASCKKIRNEHDAWEPVESYITERTDTLFSHGLCPGCFDAAMNSLTQRP
jgi:DNA-binding response OmpR family regulator